MATSLVGITSIGLLQRSVNVGITSWDILFKIAFIHGTFLFSALFLVVVDFLHEKTELAEKIFEEKINEKHEKVH